MPISSTACSPCRLEWSPHPAARPLRALGSLLALVGVLTSPLPLRPLTPVLLWLLLDGVVALIRRPAMPWVMRVDPGTRRYTRRVSDGRIDEGEVLSARAVWPLFLLEIRPDSARRSHGLRYFPDTWRAPATRPWRLLVRALRRPVRPTASESLG